MIAWMILVHAQQYECILCWCRWMNMTMPEVLVLDDSVAGRENESIYI